MARSSKKDVDGKVVVIVSKNAETLAELDRYFRGAGLIARVTDRLGRLATIAPSDCARVLFPDEFDLGAVITALKETRQANPEALLIAVTNDTSLLDAVDWPADSPTPLVLPKPAWGWQLVDAIRAGP